MELLFGAHMFCYDYGSSNRRSIRRKEKEGTNNGSPETMLIDVKLLPCVRIEYVCSCACVYGGVVD